MRPPDDLEREGACQGAALEVETSARQILYDGAGPIQADPKLARIDRIRALIASMSDLATIAARYDRWEQIRALRREAAEEFGRARGWRLSATEFGARTLAASGIYLRAGWGRDWAGFGEHVDHFRLDRRAVGVVAHFLPADVDDLTWGGGLRAAILPPECWWRAPRVAVLIEPAMPAPCAISTGWELV